VTSDEREPPAVETWFAFVVMWALASTATATSYAYGFGYGYFEALGAVLLVSASLVAYHYRETIVDGFRERVDRAGEPVDPDEIIQRELDDGDGGGST
jgi:hypothetical protein